MRIDADAPSAHFRAAPEGVTRDHALEPPRVNCDHPPHVGCGSSLRTTWVASRPARRRRSLEPVTHKPHVRKPSLAGQKAYSIRINIKILDCLALIR